MNATSYLWLKFKLIQRLCRSHFENKLQKYECRSYLHNMRRKHYQNVTHQLWHA